MRGAKFLIVAAGLLLVPGCSYSGLKNAPPDASWGEPVPIAPLPENRDIDLLFVVDNSGSMAYGQTNARVGFEALTASLSNMPAGLPNLHVGVTSTDLGTGMFQITYCEEVGGDAGALVKGNCTNPVGGKNYIIDVEPQSCEISKDTNNTCSAHTCSQANCAAEPTTMFVEDTATGCPRCRNYDGGSLEEVFDCVANLGTMGCGFEQPLESMYKALDPSNTANTGFVRDNAFLAIILITDEDDCSGSNPQLYDNTQTDINSTLGPLTSYRCFEFGITCDINSRTHLGARRDCVPREDAAALLYPLSRYTQFLRALKDPQMLIMAAIAGPVTPSPSGLGFDVEVGLDDQDQPEVQYSCASGSGNATPGIRIYNLISDMNDGEEAPGWAYSPICTADQSGFFAGIGDKIKSVLGPRPSCIPAPLKGCADVGVEFGSPQAAQTCAVNAQCLAQCQVTDVFDRGLPTEAEYAVPACLEVMHDGVLLAGNTDRTLAYAAAHPAARDVNLPVAACWHVNYQENCPGSNFAELIISRRTDPPPRLYSNAACRQISGVEQLCNDLQDNDENCLVDLDDPCCQSPTNCAQ